MMRELAERIEPEHTGETLQRMSRPKNLIDEIWIDLTCIVALLLEIAQVLEHSFENLLALGYEFVVVLGFRLGATALLAFPARAFGRHAELALFAASRQEIDDDLAKHLGLEGLDEISIRAEPEPFVPISIGALRRNDHKWNVGISFVVPNERNEFEAVDVRHVDIGHDEVELLAGQKAQRLEAALGLDNLDRDVQLLEARSQQRPHCRGVFYDQNSLQNRLQTQSCTREIRPHVSAK
jgi:hypothetical protein